MILTPIKTEKIRPFTKSLWDIIDEKVTDFPNRSVLVITSKIVSICEGRVVKIGDREKTELIEEESNYYIPPKKNSYDITITITRNVLIPTAGIDESNGDGYYILWPNDPYKTAKEIREKLTEKFGVSEIGVLITDSKTTPMRYGITGISIGYSGFHALHNYIGTPDIFGRNLEVTKASVADGLAAAAVFMMGEGKEQTPLVQITDIPHIQFDQAAPSEAEVQELALSPDIDIYGPLLKSSLWVKGKRI